MSLINQMLKDIDKRQGAKPASSPADVNVRGVAADGGKGKTIALIAIGVIAVVAVLMMTFRGSLTPNAPSAPPAAPSGLASAVKSEPPVPPGQSAAAVAPSASAAKAVAPEPAPQPAQTASTKSAPPAAVTAAAPAAKGVEAQPVQPAISKSAPAALPAPPSAPAATAAAASPKASPAQGAPSASGVAKVVTPAQKSENLLARAQEALRQSRINEAQEFLKTSLAENPSNHEARQLYARVLIDVQQIPAAEKLLVDGLALAPNQKSLLMTLGHAKVQANDLDGAIAALQKGLSNMSGDPEVHAFLAALYQRKGRHEEAKNNYIAALRRSPNNASWLVGLGVSLQAQNQLAPAAEAYQRALDTGSLPATLSDFAQQRLNQIVRAR